MGLSSASICQLAKGNKDSVAPAGLGYRATTFPAVVLWKKNARLIGSPKLSHNESVSSKVDSRRALRGINFQRPTTFSKRSAQASQAQIILRVSDSSRCRCSGASSALQKSQTSAALDAV